MNSVNKNKEYNPAHFSIIEKNRIMNSIPHFKNSFLTGITKLEEEISKFHNENDPWKISGDVSNSAGNLALHLIGNLNHFLGAQLGHTGYVREREKEFSEKNIPPQKIIQMLRDTHAMTEKVFDGMKDDDLQKNYPLETFGGKKTTLEVLLILIAHFQYHLGQINYLRRMVSPVAM